MSDTYLKCDDCGKTKHTSVWYPHNHSTATEDFSVNICMECENEPTHRGRVIWDQEDADSEEQCRQHDRELDY